MDGKLLQSVFCVTTTAHFIAIIKYFVPKGVVIPKKTLYYCVKYVMERSTAYLSLKMDTVVRLVRFVNGGDVTLASLYLA